ncbi:uncharacterized protein BXZ73DRAFT_20954, partial [Epithele typhae]|uniref:uncharacterized protein n=1 Tax=Epithele typhae TaxID=378194 RepID=UPI002008E2C0
KHLWFDDGTVIIVAGSSSAFKVYKGILASVSSVFADLFSLPRSQEDSVLEGCPVVRVQDSAIDMAHFLTIVFRPGHDGLKGEQQHCQFSELASLLRLAHKYDVADAIAIAVDRLTKRFCDPFQSKLGAVVDWDEIQTHLTTSSGVTFDPADAVEALNLMRLVNSSFAPTSNSPRFPDSAVAVAIFYCCIALESNPRVLRVGAPRADGTVEMLSDADFDRCVRA